MIDTNKLAQALTRIATADPSLTPEQRAVMGEAIGLAVLAVASLPSIADALARMADESNRIANIAADDLHIQSLRLRNGN